MSKSTVLTTVTGELFQPVRLHYVVFDVNDVLKCFRSLRCMDFDPPQERWVWLYEHEARNLKFRHSYHRLSPKLHPIVIGSFYVRGEKEAVLDLRSIERAVHAIGFFDRHIPRHVAKVTDADIVNRLFSIDEATASPESIFDQQKAVASSVKQQVEEAIAAGPLQPGVRERLLTRIEEESRRPLPEVERLPTNFYEDGVGAFRSALQFRQRLAFEHWRGNVKMTLADLIRQLVGAGTAVSADQLE